MPGLSSRRCTRLLVEPLEDRITPNAGVGTFTPDTAAASLVFAATAADVTNVIVGGEFVVRDGRHVKLDVAEELRRSIADLGRSA